MRSETVLALALLGCGDPIVGTDYLGTPAFEVEGTLRQAERPDVATSELRLSLFWIGFDSRTEARTVVEQSTVVDQDFGRFRLALFESPRPEALAFADGVGLALIVLYADSNANGELNTDLTRVSEGPDVVLGASPSHIVAYVAEAIEPDDPAAEVLGALEPGFHLFESTTADCRFVEAEHCVGSGDLIEVDPAEAGVVLALHPAPEAVLVPNPEAPGEMGSGTNEMPPGNIYGGVD